MAEAQQAADDLDAVEVVDGRQGSLSSRRPKTPRCEGGDSPAPSPNARSRKMRKSARDKHMEEGIGYRLSLAPCMCCSSTFHLCHLPRTLFCGICRRGMHPANGCSGMWPHKV